MAERDDEERDDEQSAPPYEFSGGESSGDDDASGDDSDAKESGGDDERSAKPYEFSGGESAGEGDDSDEGEDDSGDGDDSGGDDEGSAKPYEFSGGESAGEGDEEDESADDEDESDEDDSADDQDESDDDETEGHVAEPGATASRDDGRSAPEYEFSGGESKGEDDAPFEGGVRRGAEEYEFSGGESSGEEAEEPKTPVTAATKTPQGEFTSRHRQEREQAKAEREAKAEEANKRERRNRRLWKVGLAVGVAAVIVLAAIVLSTGDDTASERGGQQAGPPVGAAAVNKRFAEIPQDGFSLGRPDAPVTLVEFADLQCPFCKQASDNSLPTLVDKYVRPGKLRIEFRNFSILGPDSDKAARAAAGAADQGKAWQFIDLWYLNQGEENSGYVTDDFIRKIAGGVNGLDAEQVVAASNDQGNNESLEIARRDAEQYGVDSTPSYLIGRTGQQYTQLQLQDPGDPGLFSQAIDRQLAGQQ